MVEPMLATLAPMPAGQEWQFEFKWDGVRSVVAVEDGRIVAISRNNNDFSTSYPELNNLPQQLNGHNAVLDGEIVAFNERGAPSFSLLQQRMHVKSPTPALITKVPIAFCCFDLLALDGKSTIGLSYAERRELLESLHLQAGLLQLSPRFDGPGSAVLEAARAHGLEGVVAKQIHSVYQPGTRSRSWIKVPINQTQEGIIVGWRPGGGNRAGTIGSLLLAAYEPDGSLSFIGAVGTGFSRPDLAHLLQLFRPIETHKPAVTGRPVPAMYSRGAHWVKPTMVGEVQFRNWTPDITMRHPSWRGLRPEKAPADVSLDL